MLRTGLATSAFCRADLASARQQVHRGWTSLSISKAALKLRPHAISVPGRRVSTRHQTVAMVNVDLSPSTVLGSGMVLAALSLWQMRSSRPELSKDADVVYSSIGVLVGGILIFQGWRLDPLLLFGQLLTVGSAISFAVEAVALRRKVMEQEGPVVYPNANVLERDAMGRGTMQPLPPPSNSEFGRWADLSRDPGYSRPQYDERYYDVGAYDYGSYEEQDGPSTSQYSSEGRGDFYEDTKAYGPGSGSRTWQDDLTTPKRPSAPGNSKGVARRVDVEVLDDWDA